MDMSKITGAHILQRKPETLTKSYAAELTTVSGAWHVLVFSFDMPTDADGNIDLGPLKDFDPERNTVANIVNQISKAHTDPVLFGDRQAALASRVPGREPERQPVTVEVEDGRHVVWRQVESYRYLGEYDRATGMLVAAAKADAHPMIAEAFRKAGEALSR